jgi:hypothetical protein
LSIATAQLQHIGNYSPKARNIKDQFPIRPIGKTYQSNP